MIKCLDDCSAACEMVLLFAEALISIDPVSNLVTDCCCIISPMEKLLSKFVGLIELSFRLKEVSIKLRYTKNSER